MPPSPSIRVSPGREMKTENRKRGGIFESGILFREKDDDLALFNEVQNKETNNFLLQTNDDFDDMFLTRPRHFTDYKLGVSIPARGESSDLLNEEGDKNDYDWLLTPPETPLFPSLDDEAPAVSLAPRGRPRSQPIAISRSSMMEKGYKSGRTSASPRRLNPSPRSGTSPLQSRSRPFSTTHSSPPPALRHSSPSRGLSPPPSKSIPAPRNRTPTPRRMSTGSVGATAPSRARGASPVKTSQGNSASPKIKAWQSNIPGFSLEAPPNLRTSLADRPASYVRGSSPASRNGSRSARQSMSPTASRSVGSSHSHERDQFSSYSRGSVASSGDDDADSLQSVPIISGRSVPRSVGRSPNNKTMGFSKKPTKTLSNSAPKRSFDLALRQMDRKVPQNMFRPLLSSVPSSTFYAGKASTHHRAPTSRNSSITTSSNASSDQGTSGALDIEENEQNQDDVTSDFVKGRYPTVHYGVFAMDHTDPVNEAIEEVPNYQDEENGNLARIISLSDAADSSSLLDTSTDVGLDGKCDSSNVDGTSGMEVCSGCSDMFLSSELVKEGDLWFCLECNSLKTNSMATLPVTTVKKDKEIAEDTVYVEECEWLDVLDQSVSFQESVPVMGAGETEMHHPDSIAIDDQYSKTEPSMDHEVLQSEKRELMVTGQQEIVGAVEFHTGHQQLHQSGVCSTSEADVSEGTGISLLLKSSSSSKGHLIQSRSFTASTICYDDFYYVRDSVNSMRSSGGYSNASVSSSTDLGSSRQTEARILRQSSGQRSDVENYRYEIPMKHKSSISSLSGASALGSQVRSTTPSCLGDSFELVSSYMDRVVHGVTYPDPPNQSLPSEKEAESTCPDLESSLTLKVSAELSNDLVNAHLEGSPKESILASEGPVSHESGENLTNKSSGEETAATQLQTSTLGEDMQSSCNGNEDVTEVPHLSSLNDISEMEIQNSGILSCDSQSDVDSANSKTCTNELLEPFVSVEKNDIMTETTEEFDIPVPVNCVLDVGGANSRSLTLEEATDTILFCSSIVHNLAYEAANIAIEKENSSLEVARPTVTVVGKPNPDRREMRSRPLGKRSSKSQKAHQRRLETETKPRPVTAETEEKSSPRIVRSPSKKGEPTHPPPKLESKCNCTIM
ncbi:mucin-19-like [Salvia divinorum]|uniref:Mucin-19-like n=1 Tax=Salvia divinorum TaxID=28513 RepID=A0ABD1IA91_SALDI